MNATEPEIPLEILAQELFPNPTPLQRELVAHAKSVEPLKDHWVGNDQTERRFSAESKREGVVYILQCYGWNTDGNLYIHNDNYGTPPAVINSTGGTFTLVDNGTKGPALEDAPAILEVLKPLESWKKLFEEFRHLLR
ncbi:MAG: hypothetical protein ABIH34_02235 [Nanoarchaeota archaeon]